MRAGQRRLDVTRYDARVRPIVLAVLGPTASGKSALGLALAERYAGEVINCGCTSIPFKAGWDMQTPGRKRFTEREMAANPDKAEIQAALDDGRSLAEILRGGRKAA